MPTLGPELAFDLPVLVAEPVVFEVEFRLFVKEREIAACSVYIRDVAEPIDVALKRRLDAHPDFVRRHGR
jgi:hypothetical protein